MPPEQPAAEVRERVAGPDREQHRVEREPADVEAKIAELTAARLESVNTPALSVMWSVSLSGGCAPAGVASSSPAVRNVRITPNRRTMRIPVI